MSHVAQLRLEHAQLQNRANYIEEEAAQNLQAGRHAVALVTRNELRPCVLGRLSLLLFRDIEGISARTKFVAIVARQDTMLLCAVHVWRAG